MPPKLYFGHKENHLGSRTNDLLPLSGSIESATNLSSSIGSVTKLSSSIGFVGKLF